MKSTKDWGPCSCDCGKKILPGDEMAVVEGSLFLAGHETNRRTRYIKTVKKGEDVEKEDKK